jgi:phospholipid transport system transporter-binding protein
MPDALDILQSLDSLTVANASTALQQGFDAIGASQVTFDLRNLQTVDSAAVSVMLAWRRAAQKAGQPLELKNLPPNLKSLTKLYGVCELLFDASDMAATADLTQGAPDH